MDLGTEQSVWLVPGLLWVPQVLEVRGNQQDLECPENLHLYANEQQSMVHHVNVET